MGLREEKKAWLRSQLYETAMELFAERGFEATKIRDIYERVGVSEATFFNYFPSKDALLARSEDEHRRFYGVLLTHLVARGDEPTATRIHELAQVVGSVFAAERGLMTAVVNRTTLLTGSSGANKDIDLANFDQLAEIFRQGQRTGEIDGTVNPKLLAEVVSHVIFNAIINWLVGWWTGDLSERLEGSVDVVLRGCLTARDEGVDERRPSSRPTTR